MTLSKENIRFELAVHQLEPVDRVNDSAVLELQ